MNISVKTAPTFWAKLTLGRFKGFTPEKWTKEQVRSQVEQIQKQLFKETGVPLSVRLSFEEIVFLGQREPCFTLHFLNYPKFLRDEETLRESVERFAILLMEYSVQNRGVLVFPEDTLLLETCNELDPAINLNTRIND